MATQDKSIAVIVAGNGDTNPDEISDLLDDYLNSYDEIGLMVPVTKDLYTKTVENVVDWYNDNDAVYAIQVEGSTLSRKTSKLGDTPPDKVARFSDVFLDKFEGFDDVVFLTALPDEDDEEYSTYSALAEFAIDHKIAVKDLAAGLDDIKIEQEQEPEPKKDPEPEPEKPAPRKRRSRAKVDPEPEAKGSVEEDVAEAAREKTKPAIAPGEAIKEALSSLSSIALYFEKNDELIALIHGGEDVQYRPLTIQARQAFNTIAELVKDVVRDAEPETSAKTSKEPETAPEAPKRGRGRPRTRVEEKQVFDENDEEWTVRPRGRVAKGTRTRTVNTETGEVLEEGEV